jgi:hypothetical protein
MTQPDPSTVYRIVCAGCRKHLGSVLPRHADTFQDIHAKRCPATRQQHEQAVIDVQYAQITGDTTALRTPR